MSHELLARHVRLRPVAEDDAGFVIALRQDDSRSRFLHAVGDDPGAQREWIRACRLRTAQGTDYYWVVESIGPSAQGPVGLIRLSDVSAESFVLGSWVMTPEAPVTASIEAYFAACDFGFGALACRRYFAEVRLGNKRMLAFQERAGSVNRGEYDGYRHLEQPRERYLRFRRRYRRFASADDLPPPLPERVAGPA